MAAGSYVGQRQGFDHRAVQRADERQW